MALSVFERGRLVAEECGEVQKALDAVELPDPQPCTPPQAAAPDQCPVGMGPVSLFTDNLENMNPGNWTTQNLPTSEANA